MSVTPQQFFRMLALRWPLVVLLAAFGAGAGWFATPAAATADSQPVTIYKATNISFLQANAPSGLSPAQIAYIATFDEVPKLVAEQLGGNPNRLADQVQVSQDPALGTLEITATSYDAKRAELVADTFFEQLDAYLADRAAREQANERDKLLERISADENEIRQLDFQIAGSNATNADIIRTHRDSVVNQLRVERERLQELTDAGPPSSGIRPGRPARAVAYQGPGVLDVALNQIGVPAEDAPKPGSKAAKEAAQEAEDTRRKLLASAVDQSDPNPVLWATAGGTGGLVLGLVIVALLARFDTRVRTKLQIEDAVGLPVLVEVPPVSRKHRDDLLLLTQPGAEAAEAYRALRTSLTLARLPGGAPSDAVEREVHVLMVTGPSAGDGASTITANLAVAFAEAGFACWSSTATSGTPGSAFCWAPKTGERSQTRVATNSRPLPSTSSSPTSAVDRVWLVRSIAGDGAEAPSPSKMTVTQRAFVEAARGRYDVVLLDTAPLLAANDASDLLPVADAVVLAARAGRTNRSKADRAAEKFERLAAPMAGVVLLGTSGGSTSRRSESAYFDHAPPSQDNGRHVKRVVAEQ